MAQANKTKTPFNGHTELQPIIDASCARIAPTWPLDRFIAVNPFWGWTEKPLPEVAAKLGALSGTRLIMPRAWYREQWNEGKLKLKHLRKAITQTGSSRTAEELMALLEAKQAAPARRARVTDVFDTRRDLEHEPAWCDFVMHNLSQFCAAYFARRRPVRELSTGGARRQESGASHGPLQLS